MIAPQELRQNNLIRDNESGRIGYVLTMGTKKCTVKMPYSKLMQDYEDFEPIELNEDWLLKFGFKKHEVTPFYYLEVCNDWTRIYFDPMHKICELSISGHSAVLKHIEYVHQMQNLKFDVTGEELTIKEQP